MGTSTGQFKYMALPGSTLTLSFTCTQQDIKIVPQSVQYQSLIQSVQVSSNVYKKITYNGTVFTLT